MTDTKFTGLTSQSTPLSGDIFPFVTDPSGTPVAKKVTFSEIRTALNISGFETPSGTVDGVNTTFTVANVPQWITVNGQIMYEGFGYSRSVLTLTLDNAPATNSVIRSHF